MAPWMVRPDQLKRHRWSGGPPMAAIRGPGGPIIGVWLWHDTPLPPTHPPAQSLSGVVTPSSLATTTVAMPFVLLFIASIYS